MSHDPARAAASQAAGRRLRAVSPEGRAAAASAFSGGRGKSGLHGTTVAGNARRGRPQGKCHREQTAIRPATGAARVKGCGKSAPRGWQQRRHGKPHREQNRIGAANRRVPAGRPGWLLEPVGDGGPRGMVAQSRSAGMDRTRLTGPLAHLPSTGGRACSPATGQTGGELCCGGLRLPAHW